MAKRSGDKPQQQQQRQQPSPDAVWLRRKLRRNEPFVLDELTPSGVPLYVALDWKDDSNGYRDAKAKVAAKVPAQDWSFIDDGTSGFCLQKTEGKSQDGRGGHNKQRVALSANGMKHLLAHVPNQELASSWLQHLADAESQLALVRDASAREGLVSQNKATRDALFGAGLGADGASVSQAVAFSTFRGTTMKAVAEEIRKEKSITAKRVTVHDHATAKTNAQQSLLMAELFLGAMYAEPGTMPTTIGQEAAHRAKRSVEAVSDGAALKTITTRSGQQRRVVPFEIKRDDDKSLPAMRPDRAHRLVEKDKQHQEEERLIGPAQESSR
jgi:hypothetical protein